MRRTSIDTRLLAASALLLLCPLRLAAATEPADESGDPAASLEKQVRAADRDRRWTVTPVGRLRITHPQQVSAAIGALVSAQPAGFDCVATCEYRGWLLQAEPGLAGGQLSAGWAKLVGGKAHRERFLSQVYVGYGFKAALLRTWGDANLSPPDQTFLGVESAVTIININFSLAGFRHVGSGAGDDWRIAGGIGWGF